MSDQTSRPGSAVGIAASPSEKVARGRQDTGPRHNGGYEDLEPMFAEMATLPEHDPARARLREDLIRRGLPLADHLARKFAGRGEPYDDILQVARIGLVNAVDRFDCTHGARFLGYAIPTITGEIRRHFRDHTWTLRIPRSVKDLHTRISPTVVELSQRLGRAPTAAEIADVVGVGVEDVTEAITAANAYRPLSLDTPAYGTGADLPLVDTLCEYDENYSQLDQALAVAPMIAALGERERRILMMRFADSMTQTQIAAKMGISQMHVSRILAQTLATLRQQANTDELDR